MAENKKSFILYCDIMHTIEHLTDETAGKLFKHILNYVNDKDPVTDDLTIKIAFEPIKQQLKRDLVKYEKFVEKQVINGKLGGRPKNPNVSKKTQKTQTFLEKPKKAVNVNDNDNVVVNDINKRKEIFKEKLNAYANEYGKRLIYDFFLYWTEHGDNDRKMRFEKEKTFGVKARLNTWKNRAKGDYDNPNDKFKGAWQ